MEPVHFGELEKSGIQESFRTYQSAITAYVNNIFQHEISVQSIMGQQYSKEVLDYRKKSKKEAKRLGFLPNKKAVLHPLNQAPKQTKVSR